MVTDNVPHLVHETINKDLQIKWFRLVHFHQYLDIVLFTSNYFHQGKVMAFWHKNF